MRRDSRRERACAHAWRPDEGDSFVRSRHEAAELSPEKAAILPILRASGHWPVGIGGAGPDSTCRPRGSLPAAGFWRG